MDNWIKIINDHLTRNQDSSNNLEIQFRHDPTGLGAQISRRSLALKIGLIAGARVTFPNESMYPYELAFAPLATCNGKSNGTIINPFDAKAPGVFEFDFWGFWDSPDIRRQVYGYCPHEIFGKKDLLGRVLEGILFNHQVLTPSYSYKLANHLVRLDLPKNYVGVHYRRGDKSVETPYVSIERYREKVLNACEWSGTDRIFLASDSPRAREDLDLERLGLTVVFDEAERRLDNANHKYLSQNQLEAPAETDTAIKNIYILGGAKAVVGQTNAHFATLADSLVTLRLAQTGNSELSPPSFLIPGDIEMELKVNKIRYAAVNLLKNMAKKMFPHLTLRNKNKNG